MVGIRQLKNWGGCEFLFGGYRGYLKDDNDMVERENKEKQFNDNYIEQTKKALAKKFTG